MNLRDCKTFKEVDLFKTAKKIYCVSSKDKSISDVNPRLFGVSFRVSFDVPSTCRIWISGMMEWFDDVFLTKEEAENFVKGR